MSSTTGNSSLSEGVGVDIGGSGIKGARVNLDTGELLSERHRFDTPQPSTPDAVAGRVTELLAQLEWSGPFGCTFPAVVKDGVARTAANVDASWIGTDVVAVMREATGQPASVVLNDADAAGVAEMRFGAGRGQGGVVVLVTLGTGIGTAVFLDGRLMPNTELGHIEIDGIDAELNASGAVRERLELSWEDWAARVDRYLDHLDALIWPDLIIIGGGVSKKSAKWLHHLNVRVPVVPAQLRNNAGIVGAALVAAGRADI
ncbi:MAG: ROK family protein [Actinomycetota bacterium]|nr:ROK family protein [Actinomycetota bacterium]